MPETNPNQITQTNGSDSSPSTEWKFHGKNRSAPVHQISKMVFFKEDGKGSQPEIIQQQPEVRQPEVRQPVRQQFISVPNLIEPDASPNWLEIDKAQLNRLKISL